MPNEPQDLGAWNAWINTMKWDLPEEGTGPSTLEVEPKAEENPRKVIVQKLVTEIWMYTDIETRVFGTSTTQDVQVFGEMDIEEAIKLINKKRGRGKPKEPS